MTDQVDGRIEIVGGEKLLNMLQRQKQEAIERGDEELLARTNRMLDQFKRHWERFSWRGFFSKA